jgi:hypothetical protein
MTRIIADISVSLGGFVTGPDRPGAVVLGRHLFDVAGGPNGWDDTSGYGAGEVGKPAFVAAERNLGINRDAPDLRPLPVIR